MAQKSTEKGTAQGSIIRPIEYLLYVNYTCSIIREGLMYQFADDTYIASGHSDLIAGKRHAQYSFDSLCQWTHDAGFIINA